MKTILWVEDDNSFRYVVGHRLEDEGYTVIQCAGSMEALAILDSDREIDLVLTDIKMPNGQPHGISTAMMAQHKRGRVPVVFLTAYTDVMGAQGSIGPVIEKSDDLTGLVSIIAETLKDRPAE